ncbi:MAG: hypothetical protein GY854_15615 [Deltaproteobacteria bacterium]|nr:hypothetical protein [Deltaproteobacteria bacterium]
MTSVSWPPADALGTTLPRTASWSVKEHIEEVRPVFPGEEAQKIPPSEIPFSSPPEAVLPHLEPPPEPEPVVKEPLSGENDHRFVLLAEALNEILEAGQRETVKLAEEVIELGLAVAEELASGAIQAEPQRILSIVSESLELLGDAHDVQVRLHPDLFEELERNGLLDELREAGRGTIRSDSSVEAAGCIVESNAGRVDARVRARLTRLRHALKQEEGL